MGINQSDLAKKLNISKSTVSRALANDPKIKKDTIKRVKALAKKLNYLPYLAAKFLKKNKSNFIGLIIGDITNPFYPEIISGIEEIVDQYNYNIIFFNTKFSIKKEIKSINLLASYHVEGIIVITYLHNYPLKLLEKSKIPFILTDIKPEKKIKTCNVFSDQEHAGYIVTRYLINLNHSKIALVNSLSKEFSSANYFRRGYIKALKECNIGVSQNYIIEDNANINKKGGYNSTKSFFTLKKDLVPTSIIFNSDIAAIGAYEAIYEANFRIPDDFSIVGNDDIEVAKYLMPPLTTVSQQCSRLGKESFKILLSKIRSENNCKNKGQLKLMPELIIRKSTRRL